MYIGKRPRPPEEGRPEDSALAPLPCAPATGRRGTPIELHAGPGLVLRALAPADAPALFRETDACRARLRRWLPWVDATRSAADTAAFIRVAMEQEADGEGFHALILYEGRLAGIIGHHGFHHAHRTVSIGYWLGDAFEGRGLMTAACRAMTGYAFAALGVHRVEIRAAVENRRSRAVAERLGFRLEGVLRGAELLADGFADHAVYGMLSTDWARLRGLAVARTTPAVPRGGAPQDQAGRRPEAGGGALPTERARAEPSDGGDDPALDAEMAAYYEARAPEYDDWYERRGRYAQPGADAAWFAELSALHGVVTRFVHALPSDAAVCDIGCGTGRWTAALAEAGLRVAGLDRSPAMLDQAARRLGDLGLRAVLVCGDALELPFPAATFDAACSAFVFDHLSLPQRTRFLRELARVVRPGGRILLLDSRREERHVADTEVQTRPLRDGRTFRVRKGLFTAATLAEAMQALGVVRAGETPSFFVWAEATLGG